MTELLGYGLMAAALWSFWMKWSLSRQVKAALSWPAVNGTVTASELTTQSSGAYNTPNTTYKAMVNYEYEARGRTRRNNRICIGGQLQLSMQGKARATLSRYPAGSEVKVHYNPQKPEESVLEVREETSWFYLAIGVTAGIAGYLMTNS